MKLKTELIVLLSALGIWIIPSLLIALGVYLKNGTFFVPLLISLALIFLLGQITDSFLKTKTKVEIERVLLRKKELELEQSVEVSCSHCKERNLVPVRLNGRNTFECKGCKQVNLVIFQFTTARVTTPLIIQPVDLK